MSAIQPVVAYSPNRHHYLANKARSILNADGFTDIYNEMHTYSSQINEGSDDADKDFQNAHHYHHAWGHAGLPGAMDGADQVHHYYWVAVSHYDDGEKATAYYYFGKALHILMDLTIPHHARNAVFDEHTRYETLCNSITISVGAGDGIYSFSSLSGHYNDDTPWGWADYAAHESYNLFAYVNNPSDYDARATSAANQLMPFAAGISAGFMKFFWEETHPTTPPPPPPPIPGPGDIH
jgi:phospholipase C